MIGVINLRFFRYCDKLLKIIDKNFCENDDGQTYNYRSRNASTSIVHMILMNAQWQFISP